MFPLLSDFEMTWKNIKNEDYVGYSLGYKSNRCAVGTTNGAGAHNMQIFVLSPDHVVLHALPGFWHAEDLARELRLAKTMFKLWKTEGYSLEQKKKVFSQLQVSAVRSHPAETFARSTWQGFDVNLERRRDRDEDRDTFFDQAVQAKVPKNLHQLVHNLTTIPIVAGRKVIKPINLLVHERMAARPFVPFDEFDIATFVDYGNMHYDLNRGREKGRKGKQFTGQAKLRAKRHKETKKRWAERRKRMRASGES